MKTFCWLCKKEIENVNEKDSLAIVRVTHRDKRTDEFKTHPLCVGDNILHLLKDEALVSVTLV